MITLRDVVKTYNTANGPVHALKDINLEIKRGEIYGIIGLSGAGKSTLVRCINLLERPTAGSVIVDGKDITKLNDSELRNARKNIGMIFQHFNLLSTSTVYDNIAFPLKLAGKSKEEIKKKVEPLLKLVGLENKANQYPAQLSGGQKQRVGIARALANDTKILLCDEATSALDPRTTKAILRLIKDINKKMDLTVVVITHEMQVIKELCDKVAVIDHGVIAENGTVLEIFTNPKQKITKEFMSVLSSNELPAAYRDSEVSQKYSPKSTMLLRLTFIGESADNPVIANLIRQYPQLEISILFGDLDQIQMVPFGRMIIGLKGEEIAIKEAIDTLAKQDLRVEVIGYVQRSNVVTA